MKDYIFDAISPESVQIVKDLAILRMQAGQSPASLARALDISPSILGNWKKAALKNGVTFPRVREDFFDDDRILQNQVTIEERSSLEKLLCIMYGILARKQNKPLVIMHDRQAYEGLKKSVELYDGDKLYILVDKDTDTPLDISPIIYHLIDTPEGRFLAKMIVYAEDGLCQPNNNSAKDGDEKTT